VATAVMPVGEDNHVPEFWVPDIWLAINQKYDYRNFDLQARQSLSTLHF
jgi:hypothetical protein